MRGESTREAKERVQEAYEKMYQVYKGWGQPGERYDLGFDDLKKERLIVGNPDEVMEQVMEYHCEFGVEFMNFTAHWPGMDPNVKLETIRQFGERVIPEVKRATRGTGYRDGENPPNPHYEWELSPSPFLKRRGRGFSLPRNRPPMPKQKAPI